MQDFGKVILIIGIVLVVVGLLLSIGFKIPFLGKLPGDILVKKDNFTFYAPLASSIIICIILTILLNLFVGSRR